MIVFYRILSESPNIRKINLILLETGLPHVVKIVDRQHEGTVNEEFSAISPNGTVPAIHDTETGVALFESGAILHYLAEKTGRLLPQDIRRRSQVIKWLMYEVANISPAIVELHHFVMHDEGNTPETVYLRYKSKIARCCGILERQLADRDYLVDEYSIADIAIYPWVVTFEDMADVRLADYPNLQRWAAALDARTASLAKSAVKA